MTLPHACAPWAAWRDRKALPLLDRVLHAGLLSASSHNSQPWLFAVDDGDIRVFADRSRHLGALDARRRDLFVSVGCAVETMAIAATEAGHAADITIVPGRFAAGDPPTPVEVARLRFRSDSALSPLAEAIGVRHTDRRPFDGTPLDPGVITELTVLCDDPRVRMLLPSDAAERAVIGEAVARATDIVVDTPAMVRASDRWIRTRTAEIAAHADGITLAAAGVAPVLIEVMEQLYRPSPRENHAAWPASTRAGLASAPHLGLLAVRDPFVVADAIGCGRVWQRVHLAAARQAVAVQAYSQIAQVADQDAGHRFPALEALVERRLGAGWHVMMAFRLGHGVQPAPGPSPRRSLRDRMMERSE